MKVLGNRRFNSNLSASLLVRSEHPDFFLLFPLNSYSTPNGEKTSKSSSPSAPTYNSNVMNLNTPSTVATGTEVRASNLGADAMQLKIFSNGSKTGSGASIDDLLTDKEISAKAITAGSMKKTILTNIASTDINMSSTEAKTATSATSSSFLKSMLKVSNTTPSTSFSTSSSISPCAPTASVVALLGSPLSEPSISSNSQKLADILRLNLDSTSPPISISSSRLQSSGSGLVPASIQFKNLAKKVKDKEPEIVDISSDLPSSQVTPSIPVNIQSSTSVILNSVHATSAPHNSLAKSAAVSASVSLLAALSISPKSNQSTAQKQQMLTQTQIQDQSVASSPNRIESAIVAVSATGGSIGDGQSAPRRVSVMHLFQSHSTVSPTPSIPAQSDPIVVSSPVSAPVGPRDQEIVTHTTRSHNGDLLSSQGKEISASKSVTLFAALNGNMSQDDAAKGTKLQNQPPPRYSQQSKAMPSAHVIANAPTFSVPATSPSNPSASSIYHQTPKLSLTPQSLSMKGSEADAKTGTIVITRVGSDISPSLQMLVRPVSPTLLSAVPTTPSPVTINTPASKAVAPVVITTRMQSQLESGVPNSASPSSFFLSAISQHNHQSTTTTVPPISMTISPASSSTVDTVKSHISFSKSDIQSPKSVGAHGNVEIATAAPTAMKSLSPSDLTGYIRTFRSQS